MTNLAAFYFQAVIDRWVDGDTVDVVVDLGFRLSTHQRLRLLDIDTFELRGEYAERGAAARDLVNELAPPGSTVTVETHKTGKYGRWLARVTLPDGRQVADVLRSHGFADPT